MTVSLSTLISRVQSQLLDDGTLFSTETVTASIRQALRDFNQHAPVNGAELVGVVAGQQIYELAGGSFPAQVLDVIDVLKNDGFTDNEEPLGFDKVFEDNRIFVRLREVEWSGNLLIRYTWPHTINGLDGETETTLNSDQDQIIVNGACSYACLSRASGVIESNNLTQQIVRDWLSAADRYKSIFDFGVSRYESRPSPTSEPRSTTWLDQDADISLTSSSRAGGLKDL